MHLSRVLVIGCGFAGTALALFLKRLGVGVEIYEARNASETEAGAFLYLAPNGMKILKELGLDSLLEAEGFPTTGITFYNSRGKQIGNWDQRGDPQRYGARGHVLKRAHIFRLLREEALRQGIPIHFDKALEGLQQQPSGVVAHFQDGSVVQGDLLIGADGINSRTRQIILPNAPKPTYAGLIDTGGFASLPSLAAPTSPQHMIFGQKAFFAYMTKPSGEVYWFSNVPWAKEPTREELDRIAPEQWKQRLLKLHANDPSPVLEVICATPAQGLRKWPTRELPPLQTWHMGSACLIGDAAHAMSPSAGQGASTALEDAFVLAKCLRDLTSPRQAFARFQQLRKPRVEQIAQQARRNGDGKIPNPVTSWFRDLLLPVFLEANAKAIAPVYSYPVDWNEAIQG